MPSVASKTSDHLADRATVLGPDVFRATSLDDLSNFAARTEPMAVLSRPQQTASQTASDAFFKALTSRPLEVIHTFKRDEPIAALREALLASIDRDAAARYPEAFDAWVADLSQIAETFCHMLGSPYVGLRLGTDRSCARYHMDMVAFRLLVTYYGRGTEWLPRVESDMAAYEDGAPNEQIRLSEQSPRFIEPWDITIFRGPPGGILHRTPDAANSAPSLLLRLDVPDFWDKIFG